MKPGIAQEIYTGRTDSRGRSSKQGVPSHEVDAPEKKRETGFEPATSSLGS